MKKFLIVPVLLAMLQASVCLAVTSQERAENERDCCYNEADAAGTERSYAMEMLTAAISLRVTLSFAPYNIDLGCSEVTAANAMIASCGGDVAAGDLAKFDADYSAGDAAMEAAYIHLMDSPPNTVAADEDFDTAFAVYAAEFLKFDAAHTSYIAAAIWAREARDAFQDLKDTLDLLLEKKNLCEQKLFFCVGMNTMPGGILALARTAADTAKAMADGLYGSALYTCETNSYEGSYESAVTTYAIANTKWGGVPTGTPGAEDLMADGASYSYDAQTALVASNWALASLNYDAALIKFDAAIVLFDEAKDLFLESAGMFGEAYTFKVHCLAEADCQGCLMVPCDIDGGGEEPPVI